MREARLIVAKLDNNGMDMSGWHRRLRHEIALAYGGVTITEGRGVWVDPAKRIHDEPCIVYDVGIDDDGTKLRRIASHLIQNTDQQAFYYREPDGYVDFIINEALEIAA